MIAGVEQLPQLLAAVLMQMNSATVSWRDVKRLAGRSFAQATALDHSVPNIFLARSRRIAIICCCGLTNCNRN